MKKILITMALLLCFAQVAEAQANRGYISHTVSIVDLNGRPVTDINEVYIYLPDTTTNQTIYLDRGLTQAITIPMTSASTNTGLTQATGVIKWWGQDSYDFQIGNDTVTVSNAYTNAWNSNVGEIVWPYFLRTYDSQALLDAQSITYGTDLDWVINGGGVADRLIFTPASDAALFQVGLADGTKSADIRFYTASGVGLLIDEGANTFGITGLTTNINVSSNFNTNINTGTSTGTFTVGNSASGAISFDSDGAATYASDEILTLKTTDAGANVLIDAMLGSVYIDSGEADDAAITLVCTGADGGMVFTSLADIDITTTGAAGEDITITNTGGSVNITATEADADAIVIQATAAGGDLNLDSVLGRIEIEAEEDAANAIYIIADGGTTSSMKLHNDTGTSATDTSASIQITSDLGGIELTSALAAANQIRLNGTGIVTGAAVVLETTDGGITLNADGAANGDIAIDAADDMTITAAGDLTFAITGTTTLPNNQLRRAVVNITADQADNLAATPITLVASPGASACLEFVSAVFALDYTGPAWTEPSAPDDLAIRFTDGSGAIVSELLDATGFATATADTITFLAPISDLTAGVLGAIGVAATGVVDQPLVLDNTGSEWTNSGASNFNVIVYYRIHTVTELGL